MIFTNLFGTPFSIFGMGMMFGAVPDNMPANVTTGGAASNPMLMLFI